MICILLLFLVLKILNLHYYIFIYSIIFQTFMCMFDIKKVGQQNIFSSKNNLAWFPEKYFPEKFRRKILFESCEKFKNIILFANYIKFDHQIFDCYIYFVLNIYFSISSLKI